jgi:hypothetical protein
MSKMLFVLASIASLSFVSTGRAGVDADPNQEYRVTPEAGAWFICAACYSGPKCLEAAHELVLEIRNRYKMPAYVFDRSEDEKKKQQEYLDRWHDQFPGSKGQPRGVRVTRVKEECVVLVGGYKDIKEAHRALEKFKKLPPPSPELQQAMYREVNPNAKQEGSNPNIEVALVNPFTSSFATRNPTVKAQPAKTSADDVAFCRKLNAHETYSVYRCKKKWTLVVAMYQGLQTIQPEADSTGMWSKVEKLWKNNGGELLEASGQNAHNFADALRKLKIEAYVMHTRWGSIVTIGGYDRPDDPRMQEVQRTLASMQIGQGVQMVQHPMPMEVPK